jgi:hypothetical protein
MNNSWPWLTLALLGAYHGINPAMGWLFAVALGLQERTRTAVLRAFAPIALGHAVSVGAVVALVVAAQALIVPQALRIVGASVLIGFGLFKLLTPSAHPRWVGMRVGFRDLTVWSFLMSTAHGAGLMLLPALLPSLSQPTAHAVHAEHMQHTGPMQTVSSISGVTGMSFAAVGVHTAAMFLIMAAVALVVYEYVGLAVLRRAWFNLDRVWASALIVAGVVSLLVT